MKIFFNIVFNGYIKALLKRERKKRNLSEAEFQTTFLFIQKLEADIKKYLKNSIVKRVRIECAAQNKGTEQ